MNSTSTQTPQGDPRRHSRHINWKWVLPRALIAVTLFPLWCWWTYAAWTTQPTWMDSFAGFTWRIVHLAGGVFSVVVIAGSMWDEPRWKP